MALNNAAHDAEDDPQMLDNLLLNAQVSLINTPAIYQKDTISDSRGLRFKLQNFQMMLLNFRQSWTNVHYVRQAC